MFCVRQNFTHLETEVSSHIIYIHKCMLVFWLPVFFSLSRSCIVWIIVCVCVCSSGVRFRSFFRCSIIVAAVIIFKDHRRAHALFTSLWKLFIYEFAMDVPLCIHITHCVCVRTNISKTESILEFRMKIFRMYGNSNKWQKWNTRT